MGVRGPIPQTNARRAQRGNTRPSVKRVELQAHGKPTVPRDMRDPAARREWSRVVDALVELGLASVLDQTALRLYCENYALWRQARERIAEEGMTLVDDKGREYAHPALNIARQAGSEMRKSFAEFGLTPAARARLATPDNVLEKARAEREQAEDFLFGGAGE